MDIELNDIAEHALANINQHLEKQDTLCWSRPFVPLLKIANSKKLFWRSEEHTSELQSHSFISYAVFCLKKKKQ